MKQVIVANLYSRCIKVYTLSLNTMQGSSGLSSQDTVSGHTSLLGTQVCIVNLFRALCTYILHKCSLIVHIHYYIAKESVNSCTHACTLLFTDQPTAQAPHHHQRPPVLHGADQRDQEVTSPVQIAAQMTPAKLLCNPVPPESRNKLSFLSMFVHSLRFIHTRVMHCTLQSHSSLINTEIISLFIYNNASYLFVDDSGILSVMSE